MSLVNQLQFFITRVGTEFKTVRATIGLLANLNTSAKGDIVSAINELKAGGLRINDAAASTTTVYSASKTDGQISAALAAFIGQAPAALDTWGELVSAIQADQSGVGAMTTSISTRLAFDQPQTLTAPQKAQGIANLGAIAAADVGDVTTDFVAAFNVAIA